MTRPTEREAGGAIATQADAGPRPLRVIVVGADAALLGLLDAWLGEQGCSVMAEPAHDCAAPPDADLVLVDVPFPRQGGLDVLGRVARTYAGTPVLALSAGFFAGIGASGAVARALGVAAALPKPLSRDALLAAVQRFMPRTG